MKANRNGICIRVVAAMLTAVLFLSLCPVIPSASAAAATYTVTFDANGGTFPGYYTDGKNPAYTLDGSTLKIKVNAGEQTVFPFVEKKGRTGYFAYDGWGETKAKMGAKTPIINSDITFKAFWGQEGDSTTVSVRVADGSGNNIEFNMPKKGKLYVPENPYPPSTTKKFDYWEITITPMFGKEETFKKEIGTEGDEIPLGSFPEHVLIMARWKDLTTQFLVLYHYNPPAGYEVPKDVVNEPYRSTSTNINDVNKQEKGDYYCSFTPLVGYESLGWSTDSGATVADPEYAPGSNVTLTEDLDLYVVWAKTDYSCELNCQYYSDGETFDTGTETVNLPAHMPYEDILTYKPELESGEYGGHHYTLTAVETSGTVEKGTNNITLRYEYDELNDAGDSKTGGDNIPDKFQRLVTYKIQNGKWSDGTEDDKIEVVTLKDGDDYSTIGTATLENVPEGERTDTKYSETGVWSTGNGKKPEKVGSLDNATFTLTFLEADKAIKIIPSSSPEIPYDGEKHTFNVFEAYDINGDKLETVEVTVNGTLPDEFYGTSAGQTVDIQSWLSENGKTWSDYFTVTVDGKEISLSDNAVIFQTGDLGIVPKPLTVSMTIDKTTFNDKSLGITYDYNTAEKELTVSYRYDALEHTLSFEKCTIDGIVTSDAGQVSLCLPGKTGAPTVGVEHVDEGKETIDLENLSLTGDRAGNYTIDNINVTANISGTKAPGVDVEKLSIQITPRPVDYWTFGGAKIYDGSPIRSDREDGTPTDQHDGEPPAHKAKDQVSVWPDYQSAYNTLEDGVETRENGFIVRKEETYGVELRQNEWPGQVREFSPTNANVYLYEMAISNFMDDVTEGREPVQRDDYDIDLHYGYVTIFPQSITDDVDQISEDKVLAEGKDLDSFLAELLPKLPEYTYKDSEKANGLIASLRESNTYWDKTDYPAIYTGVKLVNEPPASHTAPYKFEGERLRNESNAEGYKDLKRGTDYTVTYQRLNAAGEWEETDDFSTPGTIQVTYTGIGNYRNRIVKTYELTAAPDPGPGPDVELDDHEHYAYMIGKPDGSIDPNGKITRAEIATVIFRLLKEDVREQYWSKTNTFPDVGPRDWYNNAISTLQNLGILHGEEDGLFYPDAPITRAEMAAMMVRLYDYDMDTGDIHTKFDDIEPDAWYARYVAAAEELGLFYGSPGDPNFYPNENLTRAEAMTVYNRLLGRKPHRDGLLPESQMVLWPDNMNTGVWYYADVQEATNSHTCDLDGTLVDGERFERWLAPLPVRDWAALEREWSEAHSGYDGHDVN